MRGALNQIWENKQAILFSVAIASLYLAYLFSSAETQKKHNAEKTDLKNCEMFNFICNNVNAVAHLLAKQGELSSADLAKLSHQGVGILQNAVWACRSALPGFFSCADVGLSQLSESDNGALGLSVLVQSAGCAAK